MSGCHSVEKIGGTSMVATGTLFDNVLIAGRNGADLYNRAFVVSAYAGMTDLLLAHKRTGKPGVYARFVADDGAEGWRQAMAEVRTAMHAHNATMFTRPDSQAKADSFVDNRIDSIAARLDDLARLRGHGRFCVKEQLITIRELLAGLGGAHSAHSTALLLRDRGINARFVDLTLWDEHAKLSLDDRIREAGTSAGIDITMPIVTGYVGCDVSMVRRYSRGYSEMTFSRIAVLTGAREAIIHKEFHLSSADPKLVGTDKTRKIGRTNYDVADQLANLGMEAIQPGAGRGLRQTNIPLRARNTFDCEDEGTLISSAYVSDAPRVEIVTGIRRMQALQFFEQDMVGVKGYGAAMLEVPTRHNAWIVSKSSNANTITHYLSTGSATITRILPDLQHRYLDASISTQGVAMVSIIGSDLAKPGLVFDALRAHQ
ncbi:aspartate kinase [Bradyrhizobium cenepequi]|uniref:aspartate kinase n=1 Tax=Bradyrhizobium cenepequi TaxID=2821403 RepID=UPI001CE265F3|nr:aspartate kinase [Bradyrhizobium cenepequi]MCA6108627.1 aspartate kinase [Bradyrhizobium cenepequi]